ncbi:MAG: hypothetical protein AAF490_18185 [Chloroflexota bacterium]
MGTEGMGHALQKCQQLLNKNGRLIDIQPVGEPPPISLRIEDETFVVGWVIEDSDYVTYDESRAALETAVSLNLFHLQQQEIFAFITYFDNIDDLKSHLASEWRGARIDEQVAMQIESRLQVPTPDKEIVLEEIVRVSLLRR